MSKKRILFVTQEMEPYTTLTEISKIVGKLPQASHENGMEIRVLMPKYGTINERRHRLHEVVRLSGMNIIVDDDDFPLIIKVASIPGIRLQVYFLDNEEFFKRKLIFNDEDGKPFEDNSDRMVFFCKGVMETVRKFGWPPNLIHCHGWMTSLIPLYLKTVYKDDPIFMESKIIYSAYNNEIEKTFTKEFIDKAMINSLTLEDLNNFIEGDSVSLVKGGVMHADALIEGHNDLPAEITEAMKGQGVPHLPFTEESEYLKSYVDFYKGLLEE